MKRQFMVLKFVINSPTNDEEELSTREFSPDLEIKQLQTVTSAGINGFRC